MKIAVIGGGTAGYMAASMVSRYFPDDELYHIYDPAIPAVGVGEGTLASFPVWLRSITDLPESAIKDRCGATRKYGVAFENWGRRNRHFVHHFVPADESFGYHISAPKIVELLAEYCSATQVSKLVTGLDSDGRQVTIAFADGTTLVADFAFDARGFPKPSEDGVVALPIVPTNAALIRGGPAVQGQRNTRSVARPHGWIFIIPLTTRTAYGYIYNGDLSSADEVDADLAEFLAAEGVAAGPDRKQLRFPNFSRRRFFDGALFQIGNRASFIEPLEATAIGFTQTQIDVARTWPLGSWRWMPMSDAQRRANLEKVNSFLFRHVLGIALFVAWHYAEASAFDSPFWRFAAANFERHRKDLPEPSVEEDFDRYHGLGARFSGLADYLAAVPSVAAEAEVPGITRRRFAQWRVESFVEIANGIGQGAG